ncbi:hypothetical protein ANO14919_074980 [Xylariales sp. No.14919]|nr:hypothetical protein ANO14919_074980 [Xylariales sp. No.14919]
MPRPLPVSIVAKVVVYGSAVSPHHENMITPFAGLVPTAFIMGLGLNVPSTYQHQKT